LLKKRGLYLWGEKERKEKAFRIGSWGEERYREKKKQRALMAQITLKAVSSPSAKKKKEKRSRVKESSTVGITISAETSFQSLKRRNIGGKKIEAAL